MKGREHISNRDMVLGIKFMAHHFDGDKLSQLSILWCQLEKAWKLSR